MCGDRRTDERRHPSVALYVYDMITAATAPSPSMAYTTLQQVMYVVSFVDTYARYGMVREYAEHARRTPFGRTPFRVAGWFVREGEALPVFIEVG